MHDRVHAQHGQCTTTSTVQPDRVKLNDSKVIGSTTVRSGSTTVYITYEEHGRSSRANETVQLVKEKESTHDRARSIRTTVRDDKYGALPRALPGSRARLIVQGL